MGYYNRSGRNYLPTIAVAIVVLIAGLFAERQHHQIEFQSERDRVRAELQSLGEKIEHSINDPIRAARGLVALVSSEPDMEQERFEWLASRVVQNAVEIRNIAAAKDLIVNLVYPLAGNESAIGLDYNKNEAQRAAAYYVRDKGEFVLAGPLELVQGGRALIGRFPVFAERQGTHQFWGIFSVVLDLDEVYRLSGISEDHPTLALAIAGRDGKGRNGELFFGQEATVRDNPISDDIVFLNGSWEIHAIPKHGWGSTVSLAPFRAFLVFACVLSISLVAATNYFSVQRRRTIQTLRHREFELEHARSEVETLALHDHLTGLPNRRLLERKLEELSNTSYSGIILMDLDGFKDVNDTYGHAVGDQVLSQVAARLRRVLGNDAILVRSGGDEFVVILLSPVGETSGTDDDRARLEALADQLIESMKPPLIANDEKCFIGMSAGIHQHCPDEGLTPEEELSRADWAMYEAKQSGRNRYHFSTRCERSAEPARFTSTELIEAINSGQIVPYYQPQFGIDGATIVGVEALARWVHPDGRVSLPGAFMPMVQSLKIEGDLDHKIFVRAASDLKRWTEQGLRVPQVSVNVSRRRLCDYRLIEMVDAIDVDPNRISLELLESIFLDEQNQQLIDNIDALKARGFRVEIDDFGTGYSSITSLLMLRPHCFKIDRSLVKAAASSRANKRLLASIAEMGHALNIEVCAEGIETTAQLQTVRSVGCTILQGYLMAEPMPASELETFLLESQTANAQARSG